MEKQRRVEEKSEHPKSGNGGDEKGGMVLPLFLPLDSKVSIT